MDHIPPPPYSEHADTDIYSNSGAGGRPHPTLTLASNVDNAPLTGQPVSSDHDTASSIGDPIYTPPYSLSPDEPYHRDAVRDDLDQISSSAAAAAAAAAEYFLSRPVLRLSTDTLLIHTITVTAQTKPADLPFPQPEEKWVERDVLPQDWETFLNYLLPHHTDVCNNDIADRKLEAELIDERMSRLTLDQEDRSMADLNKLDAQLEPLRRSYTEHDATPDVNSVIQAWNEGFFGPRGVLIETPEPQPEEDMRAMPGAWTNDPAEQAASGQSETPRGMSWRGFGGGWVRADNSGFHIGKNLISADNNGFRIGKTGLVADSNGFRMGNVLVADRQGFRLGPIRADGHGFRIGGGNLVPRTSQEHHRGCHPEHHPIHFRSSHRGRSLGHHAIREGRQRDRSQSTSSSSSSASSASTESAGSLPDYDKLDGAQLPAAKQSLKEWLDHPEQPITKEAVKQITQEIKAAKRGNKVGSDADLKALRQEVREMFREFKAVKRAQKHGRKAAKRERRMLRRQAKHARRAARRDAKRAKREARREAKREAKEDKRKEGYQTQPYMPAMPAVHTPPGAWPLEEAPQGFMNPSIHMHPALSPTPPLPPMGPSFSGGHSFPFMENSQPIDTARATELRIEGRRIEVEARRREIQQKAEEVRQRAEAHAALSRQKAEASAVLALQRVEVQRRRVEANASIVRRKAEATRVGADAARMMADVGRMRMQAERYRNDEKARLKLLDVASKLEEEAGKLRREGERLMAEAVQLGEDLKSGFQEGGAEKIGEQENGIIHN